MLHIGIVCIDFKVDDAECQVSRRTSRFCTPRAGRSRARLSTAYWLSSGLGRSGTASWHRAHLRYKAERACLSVSAVQGSRLFFFFVGSVSCFMFYVVFYVFCLCFIVLL
jgi:hypothetical protein